MGRTLAHIGARLGLPKPVVLCPWKRDARERRLAELRVLEAGASAEEPVLYSDEVDIHLNVRREALPRPGTARSPPRPGRAG
jgi:hypothetical protein